MNLSDEYTQMIVEDCLTRRLKENVSHFDIMENMSNVQNNFSVLGVTLRLLQQNCNSLAANFEEASASSSIIPVLSRPLLVLEAVALGLMILLTIGGNILVIVAVVPSPTLRSPTHSLIVNLAIADLLLGVTVLPLSATRELSGVWLLGPSLCSIWTALDVLCCTASILSLCGISVDRYIGVSRPLAYSRILTKRRARGMIAGIWALALAISIAPPLGWREEPRPGEDQSNDSECHVNKQLGYVIFSACGSFYLPALVILALYALVYRAAARHSLFLQSGSRVTRSDVTLRVHLGNNSLKARIYEGHATERALNSCTGSTLLYDSAADRGSVGASSCCGSDAWPSSEERRRLTVAGLYGRAAKFRRQKKAAKTLGIVVGGFLLCWFPFFILLPIDAACPTCDVAGLFNFAFWLGYFNSCINPFIYACSSRELRRAFRGIICWKRKHTSNMAVSLTARSRDLSLSSTTSISTTRRVQ
ncbi:alpha-1A adrenergic receptor [Cryptotermes secundus]|uniref:alpha-1A adrenergic receptor n=1 Tax=Cryptotermes secundus TaxID=105785 RepID=UPI000CD7BC84|nr:alpha-1A adrenergic receptor [Cryptotermes secundus]XP_023713292.1 alpha-1A adrenergic receptor [Cryptotermes secundus]